MQPSHLTNPSNDNISKHINCVILNFNLELMCEAQMDKEMLMDSMVDVQECICFPEDSLEHVPNSMCIYSRPPDLRYFCSINVSID
jgi:hypothetical protein